MDELAITRSEAVRRRLFQLEASNEDLRQAIRKLSAQRDILSGPFVIKRLARLRDALESQPIDIAATNKALKEAVERIRSIPRDRRVSFALAARSRVSPGRFVSILAIIESSRRSLSPRAGLTAEARRT